MVVIRKLMLEDMREAMELKALCWPEELAGLADHPLDVEEEFVFWTDWMQKEKENNDVRLLLGAFEDEKMLGVVFASFVESRQEPEAGIELNGLWVYPQHRKKGISIQLISNILEVYMNLGSNKMMVYNFHYSSSNSFYRRLNFHVVDTEFQMEERLPVDIFEGEMNTLKIIVDEILMKYDGTFITA